MFRFLLHVGCKTLLKASIEHVHYTFRIPESLLTAFQKASLLLCRVTLR